MQLRRVLHLLDALALAARPHLRREEHALVHRPASSDRRARLPPSSTSARCRRASRRRRRTRSSTSFSGARSAGELPTSNGPDVPSPMTGIASPLEGILRVMSGPAAAALAPVPIDAACCHRQPSQITSRLSTRQPPSVHASVASGSSLAQISAASVSVTLAAPLVTTRACASAAGSTCSA